MSLFFSAFEYANTGLMFLVLGAFKSAEDNKTPIDYQQVWLLFGAMIIVRIINNIVASNYQFFIDNIIGVKLVMILRCQLFAKALKKPVQRDKEFTVGEILNMNSSDVIRVQDFAMKARDLILLPLEIIIAFVI
jgi:ABC-type multidrug transport system fused ATPase/permease subunit